ncbi:MAG: DUF1003 domain-containing protein [Chloroflexi bacterium]|nr:DUF1003 domain-containing protein [Chloroflexota bacterium]
MQKPERADTPTYVQDDNPALANVMERNINTIIALRAKDDRNRKWYDRLADAITNFSGRIVFLVIHIILFASWFIINSGWLGNVPFDPYPYNMLVTVVSLEAICLSIFVLITQRRSSAEAERRADLALQIGLLTEHELTHVLQMLDAIQDRMDIDNNEDRELIDLEMETRPEDVLAEIDRVRQRAYKEFGV